MPVDLSHPFLVNLGDSCMVHHGQGVILADNAFGSLLNLVCSHPGLMNETRREVLQDRQVAPNEIAIGISLSPELDWTVKMEKLLEE